VLWAKQKTVLTAFIFHIQLSLLSVKPQALCSQSFSSLGSRSGSSFKMNNFWTISHYLFKKTWFV